MGTPVLVRANDSADVIFEKSLFCLSVCCLFCAKQTRNASASTFASLSFLLNPSLVAELLLLIDSHKNFAHQKRFWSNRFTCTGSATNLIYLSRGWQILDEFPFSWTRRSRSEIEEGEIVKPPWMIEWWRASKTSMNDWMQEGELVKPPWMNKCKMES